MGRRGDPRPGQHGPRGSKAANDVMVQATKDLKTAREIKALRESIEAAQETQAKKAKGDA